MHAANGEFQVAASGDGLSESTWDAVILTEKAGGWTTRVDSSLSSEQEEYPSSLFTLGDRWVVAANLSGARDDARIYVGNEPWRVDQVKAPSLGAAGEQVIWDGTSTGDAGVLVGSTARSGSDEPAIWRLEGRRVKRVELPGELTEGRPTVLVSGLVHAGSDYVAVGRVADSAVAWSSADFASWQPTGLDGKEDYVPTVDLTDAVGRRDGSVIAVGSRSRGNGHDAMVWVRDPDGKWHDKRSTELAVRSKDGYGGILPTAVAARGQVVVMAADAYDAGGREEIHPMVSRDGGDYWEAADGSGKVAMTDGDTHLNRTPWESFRSPTNGSIDTADVARTRKGWVLAGQRTEPGQGSRPVVWLSRNASSWSMPKALPMPPKARGSMVFHLISRRGSLIAVGTVTRSGSDSAPGWVSWISKNGGRTWKIGSVHPDAGFVADVVTTKDGLLALGGVGPSGSRDAAAWSSRDGREWEQVDLGISHGDGRGSQGIIAGAPDCDGDGDRLRLLVRDVPPEGGGIFAQTVALRDN